MVFTIFATFVGAILGMRFRAPVLGPAVLIVAAVAIVSGVASGDGAKAIALSVIVVAGSLQVGYIAGCILPAMFTATRVSSSDRVVPTSGLSKPV
jgi:hypothetical protein